jgi:Cof subfamily protein (haloacid dehalogenase superfamily)
MKNVKLVATDMDHTLLTEQNELPPNFDRYIDQLDNFGITFAIASGRPLYTLKNIFPRLAPKLTFICDNGAIIYHRNQLIHKSLIDWLQYKNIVKFIEQKTDAIIIACGLESAYIASTSEPYRTFFYTYYSNIRLTDDLSSLNCDIDKITLYFPNQNSMEVAENLIKPRLGHNFSVTVSDTIWIDIMNQGVDKGMAMRMLGRYLGIDKSQMMAFGDTYNDIEMLKEAKFSYIVANATPDMRQYANFTTLSNNEFGVAVVLEGLINQKQTE